MQTITSADREQQFPNLGTATLERPTKPGKFVRIEDKVLLTASQAARLLKDVNRNMKPSYLNEGTAFTLIASCYFDSDKLDFFHHHFLKAPKRYKLRIRQYAPNGVWSDEAPLIELKSKENGISKKRRFALTPDNYRRIMNGETMEMTPELQALNPKADPAKLLKWMTKINGLILEFGLKPALKVQYKRLAFEAADGFRLTMDQNIEIQDQFSDMRQAGEDAEIAGGIWEKAGSLAARYDREQHCVLELKHTGQPPEWVNSFLKRHEIAQTSFSKYCWAVHETARPEIPVQEEDSVYSFRPPAGLQIAAHA
jgi:SPX domain protein involved in polyphosphate accumulation